MAPCSLRSTHHQHKVRAGLQGGLGLACAITHIREALCEVTAQRFFVVRMALWLHEGGLSRTATHPL